MNAVRATQLATRPPPQRRSAGFPMLRRSSLLLGRRAGGRGLASAISIPGTPRVLQDVAKIELLQPEAPARITAHAASALRLRRALTQHAMSHNIT